MTKALLLLALATGQTPLSWGESDPYAEAVRTGKPLVIGVSIAPPEGNPGEWLIAYRKTLEGYKRGDIVVCRKSAYGNYLVWVATLGAYHEAEHVRAAILAARPTVERMVTRPAATPFSEAGSARQTADADPSAAGQRWIWSDADIPDYMEWYTPARYTQQIAVTNGRDTITPVHRSRLEAKWRVPGGLVGIKGWRSQLYRWAPGERWVGNIPVLNSLGYFQNNRGWKVKYEAGTEFLDVLTNTETGSVFEVRKAMKTDSGWQRFVTYRDPAHRPKGYAGPRGLDCRGCHSEAGSGGYATGLVPGGDTVLSMPFPALE